MKDSLLLIPSNDEKRILALEGHVSINQLSNCITQTRDRAIQKVISGNEETNQSISAQRTGDELTLLQIDLGHISPFMCNLEDFDGTNLHQLKRRRIIEPSRFQYTSRKYLTFDSDNEFKICCLSKE